LDKVGALPGITALSASTGMPIIGTNFGMPFNLAGQAVSDPSSRPGAGFTMATPEFFKTFGIHIEKGPRHHGTGFCRRRPNRRRERDFR